jgi:GNAT superfamily N-acetyltransferase
MTAATISIRPTRLDETGLLPEVERSAGETFRDIPDLAWVADDGVTGPREHHRLASLGTSWVAVSDDQLLGFACAEHFGHDLHVWIIVVRREAQGQGLGTRLMHTVLEHAFDSGAARVTLTTFRGVLFNEPFYHRLGFMVVPSGGLDERLRRTLAAEAAAGFPAERRCAMQRLTEGCDAAMDEAEDRT